MHSLKSDLDVMFLCGLVDVGLSLGMSQAISVVTTSWSQLPDNM